MEILGKEEKVRRAGVVSQVDLLDPGAITAYKPIYQVSLSATLVAPQSSYTLRNEKLTIPHGIQVHFSPYHSVASNQFG